MKVLFPLDVSTLNSNNPFVLEMIRALDCHPSISAVTFGATRIFWPRNDYDVIHFHWPEAVFGYKPPSAEQLDRLRQALDNIRPTTRVVSSVHNYRPHHEFGDSGAALFDMVYAKTDAFIHLGYQSRDDFLQANANKSWCRKDHHHIIRHGDYEFYDSLPPDTEIRDSIKRTDQDRLVLVFGSLRDADEELLAREAFLKADVWKTKLVFAGAPAKQMISPEVIKSWKKIRARNVIRRHYRIRNEQVAPLFEASSLAFVSRAGRLNSGIVPLAFTYGLPVVGPDEGVIGEMLRDTGNFVYEPGNADAAAVALRSFFAMRNGDLEQLRSRIRDYRETYMRWPGLSEKLLSVYRGDPPADIRPERPTPPSSVMRRGFSLKPYLWYQGIRNFKGRLFG